MVGRKDIDAMELYNTSAPKSPRLEKTQFVQISILL